MSLLVTCMQKLAGLDISIGHQTWTMTSTRSKLRSCTLRWSERSVPFRFGPEQGIKLLGLLLTGSTGQRMASRNGLA